jgi:hypothetical protein
VEKTFKLSKFIYIGEDEEELVESYIIKGNSAIEVLVEYDSNELLVDEDENGRIKFYDEEDHISGDDNCAQLFLEE